MLLKFTRVVNYCSPIIELVVLGRKPINVPINFQVQDLSNIPDPVSGRFNIAVLTLDGIIINSVMDSSTECYRPVVVDLLDSTITGIEVSDIIVALNGISVTSYDDFALSLGYCKSPMLIT